MVLMCSRALTSSSERRYTSSRAAIAGPIMGRGSRRVPIGERPPTLRIPPRSGLDHELGLVIGASHMKNPGRRRQAGGRAFEIVQVVDNGVGAGRSPSVVRP